MNKFRIRSTFRLDEDPACFHIVLSPCVRTKISRSFYRVLVSIEPTDSSVPETLYAIYPHPKTGETRNSPVQIKCLIKYLELEELKCRLKYNRLLRLLINICDQFGTIEPCDSGAQNENFMQRDYYRNEGGYPEQGSREYDQQRGYSSSPREQRFRSSGDFRENRENWSERERQAGWHPLAQEYREENREGRYQPGNRWQEQKDRRSWSEGDQYGQGGRSYQDYPEREPRSEQRSFSEGQPYGREYQQRGWGQGPYAEQGYSARDQRIDPSHQGGPQPGYGYDSRQERGYQQGYPDQGYRSGQGWSERERSWGQAPGRQEYQSQGEQSRRRDPRDYGRREPMREYERRGLEDYYGAEEHFSQQGQPGFRQGVEQPGYAQQPFDDHRGQEAYPESYGQQPYGREPWSRQSWGEKSGGSWQPQAESQQQSRGWQQRRQQGYRSQGPSSGWQQRQSRGDQESYERWLREHEYEPARSEAERQLEGLQDDNERMEQPRSQRQMRPQDQSTRSGRAGQNQSRTTQVRASSSASQGSTQKGEGAASSRTRPKSARTESRKRGEAKVGSSS